MNFFVNTKLWGAIYHMDGGGSLVNGNICSDNDSAKWVGSKTFAQGI